MPATVTARKMGLQGKHESVNLPVTYRGDEVVVGYLDEGAVHPRAFTPGNVIIWHFLALNFMSEAPESQPRPDRRDTLATDLQLTCDTLRSISDRPTTWARPPRVTCLTRQKFAWDKNFKSDLRPIYDRMTYEATEWFTTSLQKLFPRPFLTVKSGRGACRFQWRVSPSHCEYSRVTYDLLVSDIGGLYDLTDQLPSNHEFGNILVVSLSQVPREFGVNVALTSVLIGQFLFLLISWGRLSKNKPSYHGTNDCLILVMKILYLKRWSYIETRPWFLGIDFVGFGIVFIFNEERSGPLAISQLSEITENADEFLCFS